MRMARGVLAAAVLATLGLGPVPAGAGSPVDGGPGEVVLAAGSVDGDAGDAADEDGAGDAERPRGVREGAGRDRSATPTAPPTKLRPTTSRPRTPLAADPRSTEPRPTQPRPTQPRSPEPPAAELPPAELQPTELQPTELPPAELPPAEPLPTGPPASALPAAPTDLPAPPPGASTQPEPHIITSFANDLQGKRTSALRPRRSVAVRADVDGCNREYGTVAQCIPKRLPRGEGDLCSYLGKRRFDAVRVHGPDRLRLDRNRDGVACN